MCAPSRPSRPSPPPAPPAPEPTRTSQAEKSNARRVGKTLRQASPSQRGRGVLIRSRNPLGISTDNNQRDLGTRRSLLTVIPNPLQLNIGGY